MIATYCRPSVSDVMGLVYRVSRRDLACAFINHVHQIIRSRTDEHQATSHNHRTAIGGVPTCHGRYMVVFGRACA